VTGLVAVRTRFASMRRGFIVGVCLAIAWMPIAHADRRGDRAAMHAAGDRWEIVSHLISRAQRSGSAAAARVATKVSIAPPDSMMS
jgi:hypothetical protein